MQRMQFFTILTWVIISFQSEVDEFFCGLQLFRRQHGLCTDFTKTRQCIGMTCVVQWLMSLFVGLTVMHLVLLINGAVAFDFQVLYVTQTVVITVQSMLSTAC
jgi:hypothetical protein